MNARAFQQFSLRSALAFLTLVAMVLGTLPHIQSAREVARRRQCVNSLQQHSGFHGVGCDVCRACIVGVVRGSSGYTADVPTRQRYIWIATEDLDADQEVVDALKAASRDKGKAVRESATAALNRLKASE